MLINEVDEEGNNVELGGEFLLEPNDHFNNLSVNLSLSVVQVPTNMYNKGRSQSGREAGGGRRGCVVWVFSWLMCVTKCVICVCVRARLLLSGCNGLHISLFTAQREAGPAGGGVSG